MEQLIHQFFHAYFWVFLLFFTLHALIYVIDRLVKKEGDESKRDINFISLIAYTLFIMSWQY